MAGYVKHSKLKIFFVLLLWCMTNKTFLTTLFQRLYPPLLRLAIQAKKTDFNTKINKIDKKNTDHDHNKYITTPELNTLTAETFAAGLAQANLASKRDIANFFKKLEFDDKLKKLNVKVTSNKTRHLLVGNEFKKLQTFDSSLFLGQSYFNNHGAQLYLIFQPIHKTISIFSCFPDTISKWESERLPNENFFPTFKTSKSLSPKLVWYNYKIKLKFAESCLKQENKAAFTPKNVIIFFLFINQIH